MHEPRGRALRKSRRRLDQTERLFLPSNCERLLETQFPSHVRIHPQCERNASPLRAPRRGGISTRTRCPHIRSRSPAVASAGLAAALSSIVKSPGAGSDLKKRGNCVGGGWGGFPPWPMHGA